MTKFLWMQMHLLHLTNEVPGKPSLCCVKPDFCIVSLIGKMKIDARFQLSFLSSLAHALSALCEQFLYIR